MYSLFRYLTEQDKVDVLKVDDLINLMFCELLIFVLLFSEST